MKKIIAFGASSSKNSINKQLATYTANQFQNVAIEILDLNDYEMPIFSVDKQAENGIHPLAHDFYVKIGSADLIIISFASTYSTTPSPSALIKTRESEATCLSRPVPTIGACGSNNGTA